MKRLGTYIHFPWCLKKCPYCDFVSFERGRDEIDHAGYTDAVVREVERRAEAFDQAELTTVFIGGGTPSLWHPDEVGRLLDKLPIRPGKTEVTIECNPTSIDAERAAEFCAVGVNRLSIGVQGLEAERLGFLGRLHDPAGALAALKAASSAPCRFNADLIYGVKGQSAAEAADEADRVAALGPGHVSAYALTIEPNTQFGQLHREGRLPLLPDDTVAESFTAVGDALRRRGLERYEISNYARPGQECQHNLGYWRGDDYLGLGCAAFGTVSRPDGSALRYRNPPNPDRYLDQANSGDFVPHETEELTPELRLRERIMLGLRLTAGFDLEAAATELGVEPWPPTRQRRAESLVNEGRLEIDGGHLRIPEQAMLFADGIAGSLF